MITSTIINIVSNIVSNVDLISAASLIRFILLSIIIYVIIRRIVPQWRLIIAKRTLIDALPGPTCANPLLGNVPMSICRSFIGDSDDSKNLLSNLMQSVTGYTRVYAKEKIFRVWLSFEPIVFLWNPETAEVVLSNNFLLEKSSQYHFLHPWLGTGLLTSSGQKWRTRRKLLVPAFHFKILHDFIPVFNDHGVVLVERLHQIARRRCPNCTIVDIVPIITACTLDVICETIMGVSIGAQKNTNNGYCKSVTEVGECFLERLLQPMYWPDNVYYRSMKGKRFSENLIKLHDFTRKVIRDRKAQILNHSTVMFNGDDGEERRKAFLDLLLNHHINNGQLNEEDIREEVDTFMFEGHDTTAMALSWIIFLLGHHPEIQARASAEVDSIFEETEANAEMNGIKFMLTLDRIKEFKYLECVIKEGLRLCPSVPFVGRKLHEDFNIKGYKIPSGTVVFVYIYMLHRDANVFPEPETFNPDRFLPENSIGRHPFAFVPFSAGPRNCIGQRFAMSELKVILAFLLRNFRFESMDERDKIITQMEMVLRPKCPIRVRVHERQKYERMDDDSIISLSDGSY